MRRPFVLWAVCCVMIVLGASQSLTYGGLSFNGHAENQIDALNYYYAITGGKFVNGQTVNGNNASGGVFRFLVDDPACRDYPLGKWNRDDWFPENAGWAMTLYNNDVIVFDNNGIENGTYGDYYSNKNQQTNPLAGLYRGYSMSNNYDWIYAGYFKLNQETTITKIVGYFDGDGYDGQQPLFDPYHPLIGYAVNIWSSVTETVNGKDYLMPKLTGGFFGDVLSSEPVAGLAFRSGKFSVSYTGVDRVFYNSDGSVAWTDPIYRLVYELDDPFTLGAGEYFFGTNAKIVPEPGSMTALAAMCVMGAGSALVRVFRRRGTK